MKSIPSLNLTQVLGSLEGGVKTAAAASAAQTASTSATDQAALVTQKCAELLGGEKTAAVADPTKTASGTSLVREKVAQLADATMEAEVERQAMLGAAYTDGAMRRFAAYVPILESMGMLKSASADMPFEKFASEYPDIYKAAEELGYLRQRDEIAAIYTHGQKISYDRMTDLSIRNARELYLRGFEDIERVISAR